MKKPVTLPPLRTNKTYKPPAAKKPRKPTKREMEEMFNFQKPVARGMAAIKRIARRDFPKPPWEE
jgi:hypothetical protein